MTSAQKWLRNPYLIALVVALLLLFAFVAYVQSAFTGVRCEAAKHLDDPELIGDCYGCHQRATPKVAEDWYKSKHGVVLVRCQTCHGQPDGKGGLAFERIPGVERCASCHSPAIDRMTAAHGKTEDCATCHPNHARPTHSTAYENRQEATQTTLD